jgi:cell division initiation protein
MKLTPLDIRHKEFHRGMRGYADAEVDEFLDGVADEFERVFKENLELSERLDSLKAQLDHYRSIEGTLQKTLVSAQQNAEEQRAAAQREAQLVLRDAEVKARDTLSEAYSVKQSVEREIVMLRNAEADFRFKFRALLEGYLKQLTAAEAGAREKAGEFERQARALRDAISESGQRPSQSAEGPAQPAAAAAATPPEGPRAETPAQAPGRPGAGAPAAEPEGHSAPAARPEAPAPATRPGAAQAGPTAPSAASPPGGTPPKRPAPETPPSPQVAAQPAAAAPQPSGEADEAEDTAVLDEPEVRRLQPDEEEDDFFADVDDRIGGKEFKW